MKTISHGILVKRKPYSESSLIVTFFTKEAGLETFLFQGGKKKKGNILQALGMFELAVYKRPESDLGKLSTIDVSYTFQSIPFHPVKSGLAFFLAEIIEKSTQGQGSDPTIFNFLEKEIIWLDQHDALSNYPIWFLVSLADFLGFRPHVVSNTIDYFDMQEGELTAHEPAGHAFVSDGSLKWLGLALKEEKESFLGLKIPKRERLLLTEHLLVYFSLHITSVNKIKSWEILRSIF